MKKIIAVLAILSIILSLASCNVNDQDDAEETKEIVLGNEVESVVLTTFDGENITIDTGADFYEIFNKVKFWNKSEKKYSYTAETKLDDNSKSFTTMNIYYPANADFTSGSLLEAKVKKEGDDAVATIEEYSYSKESADNKREMIIFNNYTYKEEKAFGGSVSDANGYKVYASDEYPIMPEVGSELNDMLVRANHLKMIAVNSSLFQPVEPYEENGKTYDFNDVITREYKLYENYIVFKQTAPFINVTLGFDAAIMYAAFTNTDCSVTQEAYCNVHTGEIEMIKIYGNTLWYAPGYAGQKMEINMQMYIHDITDAEIQQKVDTLIDHVKTSAE